MRRARPPTCLPVFSEVENVREALDVIMDVTEQRTQQAIAGLHHGLQDHLASLAEPGAGEHCRAGTLILVTW
jgi:hypothetical protein